MQELRTSYDQICADYHELIKDMEGNRVNITKVSRSAGSTLSKTPCFHFHKNLGWCYNFSVAKEKSVCQKKVLTVKKEKKAPVLKKIKRMPIVKKLAKVLKRIPNCKTVL